MKLVKVFAAIVAVMLSAANLKAQIQMTLEDVDYFN